MNDPWRLRGYTIEALLGRGSSGDVWRARTTGSGDPVALKRIPAVSPEHVRQAEREAALLSSLDHPHLIRLHALEQAAQHTVLVLDLADGGSLAQLVHARGRLSPGEVITAVAPIAAALAYLHDEGVVHGDVSAANILFTAGGVPLLADVGVARISGDDCDAMSTPSYVDPAVAAGGVPGAQSDVFMLAGVALHALTGAPPWRAESAEAALAQAAAGRLPDVAGQLAAAGAEPAMVRVLCRALNVDPHRRGTAADLALDLRHSGEPVAVELAAGRLRRDPAPATRSGPRHAAAVSPRSRPGGGVARTAGEVRDDGIGDDGIGATAVAPVLPLHPARPPFERPAPAGAPPPTRLVGVRPRPVIPRRRRPARGRAVLLSLGAVLAVLLAAVGALWARERRVPVAHVATAAHSSAVSRPVPAARSGDDASAAKSRQPVPTQQRATASTTVDWRHVLDALDATRARAFANRDTGLLADVYVPGALRRADAVALLRLVPAGCGLYGVRTTYSAVRATLSGTRTVLIATARLPVTRLTCHGKVRATARGTPPTALRLELVRTGAGPRIAGMLRG